MSLRLKYLQAVVVLGGLGGACGAAPPSPVAVDAPAPGDVHLVADTRVVEATVPRRSTLAGLFAEHGLAAEAARLVDAVRAVFNPRRLRAGHAYRLAFDRDEGTLRRFEYHIDEDAFLRVSAAVDGFAAELVPYVKTRMVTTVHGAIDATRTSLVAAVAAENEGVTLAIGLAEIFGGEIDFNNDLRRGDRFGVLFEKVYREEQFSGYGDVMAAEFVNDGRTAEAFRFQVPGEPEAQYFDADGRSTKRLFLRSPLRFEPRITSRFSYRRMHPVLGGVRPHLGVDYGAPTGEPVIAVANGTVVSAGRSGGSGNMVRLRHTNGYETYYLHLSAFATGVVPGARVAQGQMIGRVGATGLATGPHLDYRMRKNGVFVNPLVEHRNLPPGDPVPDEHLAAFYAVRDLALERLTASAPLPSVP